MHKRSLQPASRRTLSLFIGCLWLLYGILFYDIVVHRALGIRLFGHSLLLAYVPTAAYCAMILLGIAELFHQHKQGRLPNRHINPYLLCYSLVIAVMIIQLPFNANRLPLRQAFEDMLVWLLPFVAVFGMERANWRPLLQVLRWQAVLGLVASLVIVPMALRDPILLDAVAFQRRVPLASIVGGSLGSLSSLLYASPFLVLAWRLQSLWLRIVAFVGLAVSTWVGIMGQFRNRLVTGILVVLLAWWFIPWRTRTKRARPKFTESLLRLIVGAILIGSLLTNVVTALVPDLTASGLLRQLQATQQRMFDPDRGVQTSLLVRVQESREALAESSTWQLIAGQGVASTWSGGTLFLERRHMLHLGFGHLVFRGGILLLVLFMVFPFGASVYASISSRDPLILVCAGLLLLRFVFLFIANQFDLSLGYVLTFLCAGGCLMRPNTQATSDNQKATS